MRFGTYHVFQCPPWLSPAEVFAQEIERVRLAEALGYDSVWVPEQHFFPYCLSGDALHVMSHIAGLTRRVRIGAAVVNLVFTHPLRFAERVAMLDHMSGGRAIVGVGRGYQFPQYPVFGVNIDDSREIFNEALDVVLRAWEPDPFSYKGRHFDIPEVRLWPTPVRRPEEILLHTAVSGPSVGASIERGLPAILSKTFDRIETEAAWFRSYGDEVAARRPEDVEMFLDRTTVMKYVFVAPTRAEAREVGRKAFEWHYGLLNEVTTATAGAQVAHELYQDRSQTGWPDNYDYDDWAENVMIYDDPAGVAEKIAVLRDAGVRNLILWMGVGGMEDTLVRRSMELFAREVMPRFPQ